MNSRVLRASAAGFAGAALALSAVAAVSAHQIFSAGSYRVAIGWLFEPAGGTATYVGAQNAVQVFVDMPTASDPIGTAVGDLNGDCTHPDIQVTVKVGGTTSSPYCPASVYDADTNRGRQDEYDAPLTPTVVGTYTFHIFGTIHGTPVDQTITSGPKTFDSVGDAASVEFPVAVPELGAVATKVNQVDQRNTQALNNAQSASNTASTATILAVVALAAAVLLGGANLVVGLRNRRH
jgi:hypothetical protein